MADRVPTKEELRQLLEPGQLSVTDLAPQTKAVYASTLAEGQRPKATVASPVEDPQLAKPPAQQYDGWKQIHVTFTPEEIGFSS
mgnify:CR=1 FL=1